MSDDDWRGGETWWVAKADCRECGSSNTTTNGQTLNCLDCGARRTIPRESLSESDTFDEPTEDEE